MRQNERMKKPSPTISKSPAQKVEGPFQDVATLPARVFAMREMILRACASGDIEQLRPAIERNEVLPLFGRMGDRPRNFATAIEFLRRASFDGRGRETLSLLVGVLGAPFAKISRGPDALYVWPALAVIDTAAPDETARLERWRYVSFADFIAAAANAPAHRVEIGEDGVWHAFGVS